MFVTVSRPALIALTGALAVLLTACSSPVSSPLPSPAATSTATTTATTTAEESAVASGYPSGHIHGMSVDPVTHRILLATHDGLFDVSRSPAEQIGPTIDLMGFTTATDGTLYASGHPGPDADLPDPVGLITSADQGRTWLPVSRQGESDFHALAVTADGLIGYEGRIVTSGDGHRWAVTADDVPAYNLAGAPDGTVLATTEDGLYRSVDSGVTWTIVPGAPMLIFSTFAGATAVAVTPDGTVHTSPDAGLTWEQQGSVDGEPAAIAAAQMSDDSHKIWVATADGIRVSSDNGRTFTNLESGS